MSKLEVDKVTPQSGTTLTIGEAGDTTVINGLGTLPSTIGSAAQVLSVNAGATGLQYGTAVTDLSNLNATNLTSGTIPDGRFPSTLPTANGQNLTAINPTAISSGTLPALNAQNLTNIPGEISWQSTIITANSTIVASRGYWINTTSGAVTITLPASASVGDRIILTDYLRTWGTNALTINPNSLKFQGNTTPNPVYNTSGQSVDLVYSGATQGWIPNSDDDVTLETPQNYNVDFLVVAGGGGSGSAKSGSGSGAGGAGGYRTASSISFTGGQTYTITVGDGGAGGSGTQGDQTGTSGSNSSISGSGITTVTSTGGGGGGNANGTNGLNGGSGGGGGGDSGNTGATGGSGNTPSTTPSQGNNGGTVTSGSGYGAGGGGSSAQGANGGGGSIQGGGAGTANSITGSSVTYAKGGNGGNGSPGAVGTVNTGNGGSGSGQAYAGANGGKGVVILSMPDGNYSGTSTGSPTVATGVSGKTVLTFTGDGSYTA